MTTRVYPPEIVALVQRLYAAGATIREIQAALPRGFKAQRLVERFVSVRRPAAKRDQRASKNANWKGADAGYYAVHLRLGRADAHQCVSCPVRAVQWSYEGGCPNERLDARGIRFSTDPARYAPRCVPCHIATDRVRNLGRLSRR